MQYILTEEEYKSLIPAKQMQLSDKALDVAREIIVRVTGYPCGKGYCDGCPISDVGGHLDGTHEERPSHEISHHICLKERHYSK